MQPEPLSPQDTNEPGPSSAEEIKQPETALAPIEKSSKRSPVPGILSVLLAIFVLLAAGLGFWAYQLKTNLTASQQQLSALQDDHDKLKADYAKLQGDRDQLNTDLNLTKTDFEKTTGELTTTQASLKQSQDQNRGLKTKLDSASRKAEVLYAFSNVDSPTDILEIDTLIKGTNDQELLAKWNEFANAPNQDTSAVILLYLIAAVWDDLK